MVYPQNPAARKMDGCPGIQVFYTCSVKSFKGCCSVDPCNTGVCPDGKATGNDEISSSSSGSLSTSMAETATSRTSMNTGMATTTTTDTANADGTKTTQPQAETVWFIPGGISGPSPSPALLGTPSRPDATATTGSSSSSASTYLTTSTRSSSTPMTSTLSPSEQTESAYPCLNSNLNTSSASSGNNKALIGGIVGGILALGIMLAVIFVLLCRRRKKKRRRFTLLAWHGPRHSHDRQKAAVISAAEIGSGESLQAGPTNFKPIQLTPISTTLPTTISTSTSTSSPNFTTPNLTTRLLCTPTLPSPAISFTSSSPERRHRHPLSPIPSIPNPLKPSLHSTLSSKHDMTLGIERDLGIHPALRGTDTETQIEGAIGTVTNPGMTPELGDTGYYRQRAELATYSQSELINVPHERRNPHLHPNPFQRHDTDIDNPTRSQTHPLTQKKRTSHNPTKIITPDGVLLSANFERLSGCEEYATSFAQCLDGLGIQLAEEELLPAYACDAIEGEGRRADGGAVDGKRMEGENESRDLEP